MSDEPAPETLPETGPFWRAARDGTLMIKRCPACGEAHYPPRAHCPFCGNGETDWEAASGTGSVYSLSTMRRGDKPYTIAYVELAEGPRMLTNILADDLDAVGIGDAVAVTFKPAKDDGRALPYFQPAG